MILIYQTPHIMGNPFFRLSQPNNREGIRKGRKGGEIKVMYLPTIRLLLNKVMNKLKANRRQ